MVISRLNEVWLSDITHIRIQTGFVHFAMILDAYFRKAWIRCFHQPGYYTDAKGTKNGDSPGAT